MEVNILMNFLGQNCFGSIILYNENSLRSFQVLDLVDPGCQLHLAGGGLDHVGRDDPGARGHRGEHLPTGRTRLCRELKNFLFLNQTNNNKIRKFP